MYNCTYIHITICTKSISIPFVKQSVLPKGSSATSDRKNNEGHIETKVFICNLSFAVSEVMSLLNHILWGGCRPFLNMPRIPVELLNSQCLDMFERKTFTRVGPRLSDSPRPPPCQTR